MCTSPLHPFLTALPKCEHHMHLEGSLSPELLFSLSAQNSIPLPNPQTSDPAFASPATLRARYDAFTSLDDFLHYYYIGFTVLRATRDFEALAYEYVSRIDAAGVRHAEVFFDPQLHVSRGLDLADVVAGIHAGLEQGRREFGVSALLIPCLLRHLPVADGATTFQGLLERGFFFSSSSSSGVLGGGGGGRTGARPAALAGLGICSSELGVPPAAEWAPIFAAAASSGLRITAHAGEEGPASAVADALDVLGAERVDHGRRAAEDEALLERLAERGTLLTVCPLSNLKLKGVATLEGLPVRKFLEKGVRFSINSDDPAYFGGYIQENYCAVQEAFGLSVDEWAAICRNSIGGSWCDDARKTVLMGELEAVVEEWRARLEMAEGVR